MLHFNVDNITLVLLTIRIATGTWFVAPDCVVTASIDQRISVWKLEKEDSKLQVVIFLHHPS